MKPEAKFQAKLLKALRAHPALKDAVIWKHIDMRNGGIPDLTVTVNGITTWLEIKVYPNKLSSLQEYYIKKIGFRRARVVRFGRHGEVDITDEQGIYQRFVDDFRMAVNTLAIICVNK